MSLIALAHVGKAYGHKELFDDLTFTVNRNERIGFIGPNGCGKTTLFRLITGAETPDKGEITRAKECTVGWVAQEMPLDSECTVYEEVARHFASLYKLRREMRQVEKEMAVADGETLEKLLQRYDRLQVQCEMEGGYDFEYRIEWILKGLGIPEDHWERPVSSFSGGEKNRIALARELVQTPDVLLLDEPENHLDFAGMNWLEEFIRSYERTVIVISHNRYLLDMAVNRIWHLDGRELHTFTGNYSGYRLHQLEETLRQRKAYDRAQKKIAQLEKTIARLKSWGQVYDNPSLAKKAKSMERRKERLEEENDRRQLDTRRFRFALSAAPRSGDVVIRLNGYSRGFGERVLFDDVDCEIRQGRRIGLLAPNGAGKTTLLEDIVNKGHWEDPVIQVGKSVSVGYYSQMHSTLVPENSLLTQAAEYTGGDVFQARTLLRSFLFRDTEFDKKIGDLSGGEKARLQLARLLRTEANFLILDEPTNHLDIAAREVVEEALENYNGTLLVVSHDRYFLDRLVDGLAVIEDQKIELFDGNFSAWWQEKRMRELTARRAKERPGKSTGDAGPTDEEKKLLGLEAEIAVLEARKQEIEFQAAKDLNEHGKHRAVDGLRELKQVTQKLELLYRKWEQVAESL